MKNYKVKNPFGTFIRNIVIGFVLLMLTLVAQPFMSTLFAVDYTSFTIDPNGGVYKGSTSVTPITLDSYKFYALEKPTRKGYTFTGWTASVGNIIEPILFKNEEYVFDGTNYVSISNSYTASGGDIFVSVEAYMDDWSAFSNNSTSDSYFMRLLSCTQSGGWSITTNGSKFIAQAHNLYDDPWIGSDTYKYLSVTSKMNVKDMTPGWHTFAFAKSYNYLKFFIDGQHQGSVHFNGDTTTIHYASGIPIVIGAEPASASSISSTNPYFVGKMRNVFIANTSIYIHNEGGITGGDYQALNCPYYYFSLTNTSATITANWTPNTYEVNRTGVADPSGASAYIANATSGTSLELVNPTRPGYVLDGYDVYYSSPLAATEFISNEIEFWDFAQRVNNGTESTSGKTYVLTNDINLSSLAAQILYDNWVPIGNSTYPFAGTFDGGGHTISGFSYTNDNFTGINGSYYYGLFGKTSAATLKNIRLSNIFLNITLSTISGTECGVGGLVGLASSSTIKNCCSSGQIHFKTYTTQSHYVGGIAGYCNFGSYTIENSYNTANITAVIDAYDGKALYVGGLVGYANYRSRDIVKNCYNAGSVFAQSLKDLATTHVAGLVGRVAFNGTSADIIGDIADGASPYNIENCYNAGIVSAIHASNVGSISSYTIAFDASFNNCYYYAGLIMNDSTASYQGTPASMGEMATRFLENMSEEDRAYWTYSKNQRTTSNSSTFIRISTAKELRDLATLVNAGTLDTTGVTIVLTADIDLGQTSKTIVNWVPIGTPGYTFKGTFDGQGHVIRGLTISSTSYTTTQYVGLFGFVFGGVIKNVGLVDVYINIESSTDLYVGALAGYAGENLSTYVKITNCYAKGYVAGCVSKAMTCYVGGLVGKFGSKSNNSCKNCFVDASVYAVGKNNACELYAGGVIGIGYASMSLLAFTGLVQIEGTVSLLYGSYYVGGITGFGKSVQDCVVQNAWIVAYNIGVGDYCAIGRINGDQYDLDNTYYNVDFDYDVDNPILYDGGTELSSPINITDKFITGIGSDTTDYSYHNITNHPAFVENFISATGSSISNGINTINIDISKYAANIWLVAKWKVGDFTVTYDPNGGEVTPTTDTADYGSNITLPTPTNTPGYTFDGWYKQEHNTLKEATVTKTTTGTAISTVNDFVNFVQTAASSTGLTGYLTNDLDFAGGSWYNANSLQSNSFDGNGYKIKNVTVRSSSTGGAYYGLFGQANGATIKNLTIENLCIDIKVSSSSVCNVGGLVGYATNTTITNCHVNGTIIDSDGVNNYNAFFGGLVGYASNTCTFTNCSSNIDINILYNKGSNYIGGLVGFTANTGTGSFVNCSSTGTIVTEASSTSNVGGLCGCISIATTFTNCYNLCNINAETAGTYVLYLGGLVGYCTTTSVSYTNCFNAGNITGNYSGSSSSGANVGGLAGYSSGNFSNCYNSGKIYSNCTGGWTRCGGIVGYSSSGTFNFCYNVGIVMSYANSDNYCYGIVAVGSPNLNYCYGLGRIQATGGTRYTGLLASSTATKTNCYFLKGALVNNSAITTGGTGETAIDRSVDHGVTFDTAGVIDIFYNNMSASEKANWVKHEDTFVGNGGDSITYSWTQNVTLKAKWSANVYTIYYVTDCDVTLPNGEYTYSESEQTFMPDFNISKAGYEFDCYIIYDAEGNSLGTAGKGQSFTIPAGLYGDLEIVANWTIKTYSVNYHANPIKVDSATATYGNSLTLANPTREGYSNINWYVKATAISTADELIALASDINNGYIDTLNKYYILTNDIDLSGKTFTPIGTMSNPFKGTFDGNGYKIQNWTSNVSNYADYDYGLFAEINGAKILNLGLTDVNINISPASGTSIYVGGLVGNADSSTIQNCYVTGSINVVGGTSGSFAAGLIGISSNNTKVRNCYNQSTVYVSDASGSLGGIVAYAMQTSIINCYNAGFLNDDGAATYVGGIVGWDLSGVTINNCFVISGLRAYSVDAQIIAGNSAATITNCNYLSGIVIEKINGTALGVQTTNTTQAQVVDTMWELADIFIYNMTTEDASIWNEFSAELNSYNSKVEISSEADLIALRDGVNNGTIDTTGNTYVLTRDLDLKYKNWTPIGNNEHPFKGTFDGNGHTILGVNFTYNHYNYDLAGLFGKTENATICNLGLIGVNFYMEILKNCQNVGALVGYAYNTTFTNCYVHGNMTVISQLALNVGGLVGGSGGTLNLINCYNNVNITAHSPLNISVGGIMGQYAATGQYNTITAYNTGRLTATTDAAYFAGGIVGYLAGEKVSIAYSYNTGNIEASTTTNAYSYLGGIIGYDSFSAVRVSYCYNTGNFVGTTDQKANPISGYDSTSCSNCLCLSTATINGTAVGSSHFQATGYSSIRALLTTNFDLFSDEEDTMNSNYFATGVYSTISNSNPVFKYNLPTLNLSNKNINIGETGEEVWVKFGGVGETITYNYAHDVHLHANWIIHSSDLIIDPNGGSYQGSTTPVTISQDYNTTYTVSNPTRVGYTFKGWTKSDPFYGTLEGTTYTFGPDDAVTSTLTAIWETNTSDLIIDPNGGSYQGSTTPVIISQDYNTTYTVSNPTRVGYTFKGWQKSDPFYGTLNGTTYTFGPDDAVTSTLTAIWEINTSKLVIDPNGGEYQGSTTPVEFTQEYNTTLEISTPTRVGYTFKGWQKSTPFYGTLEGTTYTFGPDDETTSTLTAIWELDEYTITYEPNGGNVTPTTQKVTYGQSVTLPTPTKTGYTFDGWYTNVVEIDSVDGLIALRDGVNNGTIDTSNVLYKLTADLDISAYNWTPIGGYYNSTHRYFEGQFDGQNHIINGLRIEYDSYSRNNYAGLFGQIDEAVIANLKLTNINININLTSGAVFYIGGLVGQATASDSYIQNCHTSGSITALATVESGTFNVGGITASTSYIYNCSNACNITANATQYITVGGIAASSWGEIHNSYNTGTITASSPRYYVEVGGIVGTVRYSSITNCFNTGNITATRTGTDISYIYAGGIVGNASEWNSVYYCYTTGNISTTDSVNTIYAHIIHSSSITSQPTKNQYLNTMTITVNGVVQTLDETQATAKTSVTDLASAFISNLGEDAAYWNTPTSGNHPTLKGTLVELTPSTSFTAGTLQSTYVGNRYVGLGGEKITYNVAGNVTLIAHWTPIEYNIAYELDGGTAGTYAPTTATYDKAIQISNPTRIGYTFAGWTATNLNTSTAKYGTTTTPSTSWSNGSTKVTSEYFMNLTATKDATVTLTANWTINKSKLIIDPNGGEYQGSTTPVEFTQEYNTTLEISTPTRAGYTFAGWQKSSPFYGTLEGTIYTFGPDNAVTSTLTAIWKKFTILQGYPIYYDTESHTPVFVIRIYEGDSYIDISSESYTLSGDTSAIEVGEYNVTITLSSTYNNATIDATWYIIYPEITLNADATATTNGEAQNIYPRFATKSIFDGELSTTTKTILIPTKTGYTFVGWWILDGSETGYWGNQMLASDGTLVENFALESPDTWYPRWIRNIAGQKIVYDENGGVEIADDPYTTLVTSQTLNLKTTTRAGYTFLGWQIVDGENSQTKGSTVTNDNVNKKYTITIPAEDYGNITVIAIWDTNALTLTINPNGGSYNGTTENTIVGGTIGQTYDLLVPTKEGYDFAGWALNYDGIMSTFGTPYSTEDATFATKSHVNIYNNKSGTTGKGVVTSTIVDDSTSLSGKALQITVKPNGEYNEVAPELGGFCDLFYPTGVEEVYYHVVVAKLPVGYRLLVTGNSVKQKTCLTSDEGTGNYELYVFKITSNTTTGGNGHIYVTGDTTSPLPEDFELNWYVAYSQIFKSTSGNGNDNLTLDVIKGNQTYTFGATNATIYAMYAPKKLTVTFDPNGFGASVTPTNSTVTYGKTYGEGTGLTNGELPTPVRPGYTFAGWYLEETFETNIIKSTTVTQTVDHTLYAKWNVNIDEVNYESDGNYFVTFKSAVEYVSSKANKTGVITLLKTNEEATETENITISAGVNITVVGKEGLNDYNLLLANNISITIASGAILTINSGTIDQLNGSGTAASIKNNSGGTLNINGGVIDTQRTGYEYVITNNGTMNTTGGSVVGQVSNTKTLNISGGNFTGGYIYSANVINLSGSFDLYYISLNLDNANTKTTVTGAITDDFKIQVYSWSSNTSISNIEYQYALHAGKPLVYFENVNAEDYTSKITYIDSKHYVYLDEANNTLNFGKKLTVTLDHNDANTSVDPTSVQVVSPTTYGDLPTPVRPGYTFDGWYGKNLLNPVQWTKQVTANGLTIQYIPKDDTFVINGTATTTNEFAAQFFTNPIVANKGSKYTLSTIYVSGSVDRTNATGTNALAYFSANDDAKTRANWASLSLENANNSKTVVCNANYINRMWFYINPNITFNNYTFKLQVEESDVATSYEPYSSVSKVESTTAVTSMLNHTLYPKWTLDEDEVIVRVEDNYFTSLKQAVDYCNKNGGGTIHLLKENLDATDLENITITSNITIEAENEAYNVILGDNVNIKMTSGSFTINSGTIKAIGPTALAMMTMTGGTFTMTGGNMIQEGRLAYLFTITGGSSSLVNINGGKLSKTDSYPIMGVWAGSAHISGGNFDKGSYDIYTTRPLYLSGACEDTLVITANYKDGAKLYVEDELTGNVAIMYYNLTLDDSYVNNVVVNFTNDLLAKDYLDKFTLRTQPTQFGLYAKEDTNTINLGKFVNVTFDADGGTVTPTTSKVLTGKTYGEGTNLTNGELPTPTRPGYEFVGWYGKNLFDIPESHTFTHVTTKAVSYPAGTYYVRWDSSVLGGAESPVLSFVNSAGNKTVNLTAGGGSQIVTTTADINHFYIYANGYNYNGSTGITSTVNGLMISKVSGNYAKFVKYDRTTSDYISESTIVNTLYDHTLHAMWEAKEYTISYNNNGGTGTIENQTVTFDTNVTLSDGKAFTRTGYTLTGWNTNASGTGTSYALSKAFTPYNIADNLELYAVWEAITYTITYNLDGGSVSGNPTSYTVETATITLNNPTKEGYTFKGWSGTGLTGDTNKTVTIAKGSTGNRSYTANWTINEYTLTINYVCEQAGIAPQAHTERVVYNTAYSVTSPSVTGWKPDIAVVTGTMPASDVTVTVTYTPADGITYTIEHYFENLDGSFTIDNSKTQIPTGVTNATVTANYLTVTGFEADIDNVNKKESGNVLADGSLVLKLYYTRTLHTITWKDTNGTVLETDTNVKYGATPSYDGETTKEGYTFNAWTPEITSVTSDAIYTATWTANTYTISYNNNGGTGTIENQTVTFDTNVTLSDGKAFTRAGYTLTGWNTNASGTGTSYDLSDEFTYNIADDLELFAVWSANSIEVTFVANTKDNNGNTLYGTPSVDPASKSVTFGEAYSTLPTPTLKGYTFKGWYLEENYTTLVTKETLVTTPTNHNLYAKWEVTTHTVTFNSVGGSSHSNIIVTYGYSYNYNNSGLPTPQKAGYSFEGWYSEETYETKIENSTTVTKNENHTLFAKWAANALTLTINPNGGSYNGTTENTIVGGTIGQTYDLLVPTKEGYDFAGWALNYDGIMSSFGTPVFSNDRIFTTKKNNIDIYNNNHNGTVTHTIIDDTTSPTGNGKSLKITVKPITVDGTLVNTVNPDLGGFLNQANIVGTAEKPDVYYMVFIAKLPVGYQFNIINAQQRAWLTTNNGIGTGEWELYIAKFGNTNTLSGKSQCISVSDISGTVTGTALPEDFELNYYLAYQQLFRATETGNVNLTTSDVQGVQTYTFGANNATIYAMYTPKTFTVTFDPNGLGASVTPTSSTVTYGKTYGEGTGLTDGKLPIPTRPGYTFSGWYTKPNQTNLFDLNNFIEYMQSQKTSDFHYDTETGLLQMAGPYGYDSVNRVSYHYKPDLAPGTYTISYKGKVADSQTSHTEGADTTAIRPEGITYPAGTYSYLNLYIDSKTEREYSATFTISESGWDGFFIAYSSGPVCYLRDICLVRDDTVGTDYEIPDLVESFETFKYAKDITLYANWAVNTAEVVARVDDLYFVSLYDAVEYVDSLSEQKTIYLLKSSTESETITLDGNIKIVAENSGVVITFADTKQFVINGTLSIGDDGSEYVNSNGNAITSEILNSFTFKFYRTSATSSGAVMLVNASGSATYYGGTYTGGKYCYLLSNAGTTTINGGTFMHRDGEVGSHILLHSGKSLTINDGTFASNSPSALIWNSAARSVTINGGTFTATLVLDSRQQSKFTITGGTFNGNITLAAPVSISPENYVSSITGGTINGKITQGWGTLNIGGTAVINGNIDVTGTTSNYTNKCLLNITGGEINGKVTMASTCLAGSVLNITGGTFTQTAEDNLIYNAKITNISGGTFIQDGAKSLLTNSGNAETILTISGGTFTQNSTNIYLIQNYNTSVLNIEGGTFNSPGHHTLAVWGGVANISGGTFNGNSGKFVAYTTGLINLSGSPVFNNATGITVNYVANGKLNVSDTLNTPFKLHYYSGIENANPGDVLVTFTEGKNLVATEYLSKVTLQNSGYSLYADTEANTINLSKNFTVTFDPNGGSVSPTTSTVAYGKTYSEGTNLTDGKLPTPTKDGYTFSGWYGKNQFKVGVIDDYFNNTRKFTINGDTIIGINTTSSSAYITNNYYFPYTTGESYTFSFTATAGSRIHVALYDSEYNNISSSLSISGLTYNQYYANGALFKVGNSITFTTTDTSVKYMRFGFAAFDTTIDYETEIIFTNIQLEKGTTVTTYEPFVGYGEITEESVVICAQDHTLHAMWEAKEYTISYNNNGGTGTIENQIPVYAQSITLSDGKAFTRAGYTLSSWNTKEDGSGDSYELGETITYNYTTGITLYAQWQGLSYAITLDNNGATTNGSLSESGYYTSPENQSVTITLPTRTGYTLSKIEISGANANATLSADYKTLTIPSNSYGDIQLTAIWTQNDYDVIFDKNRPANATHSVLGTMADQKFKYDVEQTLTKNQYNLGGYTFTGWNTEANGQGTSYADEQSVINLTTNTTITLFAQWKANEYEVVFNKNKPAIAENEVAGEMTNQKLTFDIAQNLKANAYTLSGYTFVSWNTQADGLGDTYTDEQSVKNLTYTKDGKFNLYAIWQADSDVQYQIKHYKENLDGTYSEDTLETKTLYGTTDTVVSAEYLTMSGFSANTTHEDTLKEAKVKADGSLVLKLFYDRNMYTVTVTGDSGTTNLQGAGSYKYGTSITIDVDVLGGYKFSHWENALHSNPTSQEYTFILSNNITFNAVTTAYGYSIELESSGATIAGTLSTNSYKTSTQVQTVTITLPTKTGYTFSKIEISSTNLAASLSADYKLLTIPANSYGDILLTVVWTANTYTVTFDPNGGSVNPNNTTVTYDKTYGEGTNLIDGKLPTPTRNGYEFAGWYGKNLFNINQAEHTGTINGNSITAKDIDYYLTSGTYTISFTKDFEGAIYLRKGKVSSGFLNSSSDMNVLFNFTLTEDSYIRLSHFVSNGVISNIMIVKGTYTQDTMPSYEPFVSLTEVTEKTIVSTLSDHTLYASWSQNVFTITYIVNGEEYATENYTQIAEKQLLVVNKAGYVFFGWYESEFEPTKALSEYETITSLPLGTSGHKTFYGKLIKADSIGIAGYSDASITLDINYGSGLNSNQSYGVVILEYYDKDLGYTRKLSYSIKQGEFTITGLKYAEYNITIKTTFKSTATTNVQTITTSYQSQKTLVINLRKLQAGGFYDLEVV